MRHRVPATGKGQITLNAQRAGACTMTDWQFWVGRPTRYPIGIGVRLERRSRTRAKAERRTIDPAITPSTGRSSARPANHTTLIRSTGPNNDADTRAVAFPPPTKSAARRPLNTGNVKKRKMPYPNGADNKVMISQITVKRRNPLPGGVSEIRGTSRDCPIAPSLSRMRIGRSGAWSGFDALDGGHPVDRSVERGDASDAGALGAGHEVGLGEVETVDLVHLDCS
jgi:hypothetical protein